MRADVSFKDVQKLASGNYLCLCVFEACIHTLHHFKQSKCGCMSALLILTEKSDVYSHVGETQTQSHVSPYGAFLSSLYHGTAESACVFECVRI